MKRTLVRFALACLLTGCGGSSTPSGVSTLYNPGTTPGINTGGTWVPVGPAPLFDNTIMPQLTNQSGRVNGFGPDPSDSKILTIAAADGGLWRSVDDGQTWAPLADNAPSLSIGILPTALTPAAPGPI